MKTTLKVTRIVIKNIGFDSIGLKNINEMVQKQDERLHIGEYYFKIYEIKDGSILIKINFYFEDVVFKNKKNTRKKQKESILKSHFKLDRDSRIEKKPELVRLGRIEATVMLLRERELIEYSRSTRDLKELPNLVKQLAEKKCFSKDKNPQLELKEVDYREVRDTLNFHLENWMLERIFSGNLIEYTIEEVFENRENYNILDTTTVLNENETGYHIIYELKNINLISNIVIKETTTSIINEYRKSYSEINNLKEFKKYFSIYKTLYFKP